MNGNDLHQSVRRKLHDLGLAYTTPTQEWDDTEITYALNRARDVFYSRLVERGAVTTVNNLVKQCTATDGTNAPTDFWKPIMGYRGADTSTGAYVLAQDIALSLAMAPYGLDTVYAAGGVLHGTADSLFYYARPQDDLSADGGIFTEFSDGAMEAISLLAVIEITMGEVDDAADRLDDLYDIYGAMEDSFE